MRRARPLLGTIVEIEAAGEIAAEIEDAIDCAFAAVERVHHLMSFHESLSDISLLNNSVVGTTVCVDNWTYQVLQRALDVQRLSKGAFNIAIAPVLQALGLLPPTKTGSEKPYVPMPGEAFELHPGNRVSLRTPGRTIDLGGIAKGFAVDRAIDVLRDHSISSGLVNAGGDLAGFGPDEQLVAIRDPRDPTRIIAHVSLRAAALASSGLSFDPMRSAQASSCAIIDPDDGTQVTTISGATVKAASCTVADALTKVVMLAGPEAGAVLDHYEASAMVVMASGEVWVTADWQDIKLCAT